jgi:ACS family hexuronate transporter-like MFS transporter
MVVPTDLFAGNVVGSVAGLVGFGGAMGGIAFGQLVGYLLDHGFGYGVVFSLAATFHVVAFIIILAAVSVVHSLNLERKLSYPGAR